MYEIGGDAGIIRRADPAPILHRRFKRIQILQKVGFFDFIDDVADYGCFDLSDGIPGAIKVVCNSSVAHAFHHAIVNDSVLFFFNVFHCIVQVMHNRFIFVKPPFSSVHLPQFCLTDAC